MHSRNIHKAGYDFTALITAFPALKKFVTLNPVGRKTIDFADPNGVKTLNAALLKHYYNIDFWDIPAGYLCPPVPGRADYIHAIADLIEATGTNKAIKGLDIGTGANLIYPILGKQIYDWQFVATDTSTASVRSAALIQNANGALKKNVQVRHQANSELIFTGVVKANEYFAFSMCNPPFHTSQKSANDGSQRKVKNLRHHKQTRQQSNQLSNIKNSNQGDSSKDLSLNFAGQHNELWCNGGEVGFIQRMAKESVEYGGQIEWFTSLVSKKESLAPIQKTLKLLAPKELKIIQMAQGSKTSRFVAWRFK